MLDGTQVPGELGKYGRCETTPGSSNCTCSSHFSRSVRLRTCVISGFPESPAAEQDHLHVARCAADRELACRSWPVEFKLEEPLGPFGSHGSHGSQESEELTGGGAGLLVADAPRGSPRPLRSLQRPRSPEKRGENSRAEAKKPPPRGLRRATGPEPTRGDAGAANAKTWGSCYWDLV